MTPASRGPTGIGPLLLLLAVFTALVGVWAFVSPDAFFASVATDTGHYNGHLMRDVGSAFLATGLALVLAWRRPASRPELVAVAATFLGLHAAAHVYDIATGALPSSHWLEDLPGVFLPAALAIGIAVWLAAGARRGDQP